MEKMVKDKLKKTPCCTVIPTKLEIKATWRQKIH